MTRRVSNRSQCLIYISVFTWLGVTGCYQLPEMGDVNWLATLPQSSAKPIQVPDGILFGQNDHELALLHDDGDVTSAFISVAEGNRIGALYTNNTGDILVTEVLSSLNPIFHRYTPTGAEVWMLTLPQDVSVARILPLDDGDTILFINLIAGVDETTVGGVVVDGSFTMLWVDGNGDISWVRPMPDVPIAPSFTAGPDGRILVTAGDSLMVLDGDGNELWSYQYNEFMQTNEKFVFLDDGGQVLCGENELTVLEPDGQLRWRRAERCDCVVATPDGVVIGRQEHVQGGAFSGYLQRFSATGDLLWTSDVLGDGVERVIRSGDDFIAQVYSFLPALPARRRNQMVRVRGTGELIVENPVRLPDDTHVVRTGVDSLVLVGLFEDYYDYGTGEISMDGYHRVAMSINLH